MKSSALTALLSNLSAPNRPEHTITTPLSPRGSRRSAGSPPTRAELMQRHFLAEPENEPFEAEMGRMGQTNRTRIPGRNPIPRDQLIAQRVEAIVQFPESMDPELRHALESEFRSRGYTVAQHISHTPIVNADVDLEAAALEHPESVRQAIHEARQRVARTVPYTSAFNADIGLEEAEAAAQEHPESVRRAIQESRQRVASTVPYTPSERAFLSSNQPGRLDEALALAEAQPHHSLMAGPHSDFDAPIEPIDFEGAETTVLAEPLDVTSGNQSARSRRTTRSGRGQTQPEIRSRMNGLAVTPSPRKKSPSRRQSPSRANRGTVAIAAAVSPRQRKNLTSSLQSEGYTVMAGSTPRRRK
jgi:hypothetical protein